MGITDQNELEVTEAGFATLISNKLIKNPLAGNFDLAHLQNLHKHLFDELYEWAGQIRIIEISKGATRFANCMHIESAAEKLFDELEKENHLRDLERFQLELAHRLSLSLMGEGKFLLLRRG